MLQKSINYLALDLIDIKNNLNDLKQIYNFLEDLAFNLSFETIHKPVLVPYYYGKVEDDCGISCYLMIEGGYITFHIFEKRNIAYFDIVRKGEIDSEKIIELVTTFVESQHYNKYLNTKESCCEFENVFGPHYFCEGKIIGINNIDALLELQENLIDGIEMHPIISPVVVKDGTDIRVFILIAESHISITMNNNFIRIDIFSCKMFDIQKLKELLSNKIDIKSEKIFTRLYKT